jgi:hypothetical protein
MKTDFKKLLAGVWPFGQLARLRAVIREQEATIEKLRARQKPQGPLFREVAVPFDALSRALENELVAMAARDLLPVVKTSLVAALEATVLAMNERFHYAGVRAFAAEEVTNRAVQIEVTMPSLTTSFLFSGDRFSAMARRPETGGTNGR